MIANIKFIKEITEFVRLKRTIVGNFIYYTLDNGNRIKTWCDGYGVEMEVIHKISGKVDSIELPFSNYFKPVQCDSKSPCWYQNISHNEWQYEKRHPDLCPTDEDYENIASGIETFISLYE